MEVPGVGRRTAEAVVAALAPARGERPWPINTATGEILDPDGDEPAPTPDDPGDQRWRGHVTGPDGRRRASDFRSWSSSPACPAPAAARRPTSSRTSAGSSSTTCRRRCCRRWPSSAAARAATCRASRPSSTSAAGRSSPTSPRRWPSSPTDGSDPRIVFLEASDDALVRRYEAVRRPHPLQGDGRLVDGIAREREMLGDLRAEADLVLDTSDLNVHELGAKVLAAVRGARSLRAARDGHVVRLQVRPAGRRRPGRRLPLPAQPALGARAAAAQRAATTPVRDYVLAQPGADGVPRRLRAAARRSSAPATSARASGTRRSPSAAPAASTARSRWPRSCARRLTDAGVDAAVVHRDLGRE